MNSPTPQYKILFTTGAKEDISLLDGSIKKRLKRVLVDKLAVGPESYGTPLRDVLAGYWKHEFASHRVVYRIYKDDAALVVCAVGKRQGAHVSDVYKQLERMAKAGRVAEQVLNAIKSLKSKG